MSHAETRPPHADASALLRDGIAAAKAGDRQKAQDLLARVVKLDDGNVTAWLWLSGVVDDLNYREVCLQTALKVDPENEVAQRGLAQVRQQKVHELLQAGITAAQRGQRDHARSLLARVVEMDEKNVAAWLWLSGVVNTLEDREVSLENVLALDPGNEAARLALEQLREQRTLEAETRAEMAPRIPEAPEREGPAPSPATVDVDWEHPSAPSDEFANELLCPYCATPTAYEDRRCPACGADLVIKTRVREQRSSYLWIAITLQVVQVASNVLSVVAAIIAVGILLQQAGLVATTGLNPVLQFLFQPTTGASAELLTVILRVRLLFIAVLVELLLQAVVLVGLYMRWRLFWYLFMANAGLGMLLAVAVMLISQNIIGGGVTMLLSLLMVFLAFQLQDDFFYKKSRIVLQVDRSARSGADYLAHARHYAREHMWALAIIHYQRAAGAMVNHAEPLLALALCYIQVRRYDRAASTLAEAARIDPANPGVADVAAMLERTRGSNP
jgi:tetratricopeptide (TPR) repeat protein